jgi:hypothetical protein
MSKKFLDNIKRIKFLMEVKDSAEIDAIELDDEESNEETELDEGEVNEEGEPTNNETETASTGAGTPGVWASGLTRGKGNPIGNTKWESGITRSKGNPLK